MPTTIGRLLVNEQLPAELQTDVVLSMDELNKILAQVAQKYPDRYREISHALMQLGRQATYAEGATLRLSDTLLPIDKKPLLDHVKVQTRKIMADTSLSKDEKAQAIEGVYSAVQDELKKRTFQAALAKGNPFALQVKSKARGSPAQLMALMTTPGVYEDAEGKIIPTFIRRSYAEGLKPHEYWAATYGARKSVISTKFATRDAGYLGKQFGTAANALLVTEEDCETPHGIPVNTADVDNIGAVLARDVGKFKAGTVITRPVLAELQKKSDAILVRSPATCNAKQGICKQCAGIRETGDFPELGYNIGVNASSALAERIAQSSLNVKHSGGVGGGKGEAVYAGFPVIEQMTQVPETFPDAAPLASLDGRVDEIREAPQGGSLITINGERHYVPADRNIYVKVGDNVEAGDQLAAGLVNPRDVVHYKGIGEGRRYFTDRMVQIFKDSGLDASRRNMEVLSRALINHVVSNDVEGTDASMPGEVVAYNTVANRYKARPDAELLDTAQSTGRFLEQPVLHYTIGTRVTRGVADQLKKFGHNRVLTHPQPPSFEPYMLSLREIPQHERDWVAQLGSNYLRSGLLKNVHRSAESNIHGVHPVPAIAKGTEIGKVPKGQVGY